MRIEWDKPSERYISYGVNQGVLYPKSAPAVPFNGITGFDEGSAGNSTVLYRDGIIYLSDVDASDFSGRLNALFYPDAFSDCVGIPKATDGLYVDNQKPQQFDFSYRSLVGNGVDELFGYQIHLVYNAKASINTRARRTMGSDTESMEFGFDLVCTPVKLPGFRPSAHYILDTRGIGASTLAQLEDILYGSGATEARMPTPSELYDLMNFGDTITFTDHGDGTWTATGAEANVHMTGPYTWEILNVNGVDHGDGTFTLSDTP